ncbi:ABC transporter C family member 3-like [Carex rostrata]
MAVYLLIDLGFLLLPSSLYYFSVSLHVAFFLFLSLVWLCRRFKEERSTENVENNDFLYYKLTFHTSLGLGLFYLLFSVFNYLWSNSDFLIELDSVIRTIFWFLFSCYMEFEFGRLSEKKFPVSLRVLFGLFLLVSLYSLVLHILSLQNNAIVGAHFWVLDFGSFFMALLLNYAGIFGTRKAREPDSLLQEPLLNRTCNSSNSNNTSSGSKNSSLYTNAGFFTCLTFSWISPLLSLGYRKTLELEDIPMVDERDSTNGILPIFKTKLDSQTGANGRVTAFKVVKAIIFTFLQEIIITAIYEIVTNLSSYVGPYLIDSFVQYLNGTKRFPKQGYLLVFAFIIAKIFECLSSTHCGFQLQQVGVRLRTALVGTIYQKGLTLSSQSRQSHTIGEMINIMSVDASRVSNFTWYIHEIWLVPMQISLALTILYSSLGIASVFALAATITIMLANIPLSRIEENYQDKMMGAKDERMKATSEVLRNMRILKLQGWEMKFLQKICNLRKNEASWLKKLLYVDAGVTVFFWGTPTFVAVVTFGACMVMGIPLSTGKVLSALATFVVLQGPIYSLPDTISVLIQTKVSLDRLSSFLCLEDLPNDVTHRASKGSSKVAVEVQNGTFSWDFESEVTTLKDLNFRVLHGTRVALCGTVGSGKSSLLLSILGEMPKVSGEVKLWGSTAYVSQLPWIQSGKIQDNILFGTEMNRDRYDNVLQACSLNKDLQMLPHGDQTIIGERGINLSGGQKQRIQIARALYQDADIFLFDDPFSSLDAHTGSHVFKECLLRFLASKTVIYVTHQVEFLPAADLILVMKEGKIAQSGKYHELLQSSQEFMELVCAHKNALSELDSFSLNELDASSSNQKTKKGMSLEKENTTIPKGQLVQEEEREKGKVGFWVYWKYITMAYKGALVPLVLLAQISFQILQIGSNYWMAWAAPVSEDMAPPVSSMMIISVFVALALGSSLCILARALLLVTAGYKTATILFEKMHFSIFRAPMSFFDSTPSGRILNRATTDQSTVDTGMPYLLGSCAFTIIQLLAIITVMSQIVWQVFVVFLPVTALCVWCQRYYIETARELSRLVGVCEAPIIQQFSESLTGSTTIRSFGKELDFKGRYGRLMDDFSRPNFYSSAAMDWLSLRLEMLSSVIFAFCLVFLVTIPPGLIDPGFAGLAVTYGLNLNMQLSSVIWSFCTLETCIISVERILQYTSIPSEPPLSTRDDLLLDCSWPIQGEILLENLQLRYAPQLPFVLKGISCTFTGGTKTGIVGRTGSGKSTLIQALFRIVDPTVGRILIDNVDICTIGLHDLRSKLSIIPQDPAMFEGTIRNNLDPLEEYTEAQIWEALDYCQLGDEVRKKEFKLDSPVTENGENWSMGQRQLLCLGRVILKKSKILVLDEATASVDTATDSLIQRTLKQHFPDSTVITIAHRITSVLDSDMILLLDNGIAVESDTPAKLLGDKSSLFSQLVLEYMRRSS